MAGRAVLTGREAQVAELIARAPLVAATGGTYIVDHYRWEVRLSELELAVRSGRSLVLLTQTMGPFQRRSRGYRRLASVLEHAELVMARDERTVEAVRHLAPHATVMVAPDVAFALARDPAVQALRRPASDDDRPRVAVSVRAWPYLRDGRTGTRRYRYQMMLLVSALVRKHDARVTFISTCQGTPGYRFDDSAEAGEIVRMLGPDIAHWVDVDERFRDPASFIEAMTGFDVLVGTRMHASIMAWIAGTPSVAIAYEPKTRELFARHGMADLVSDMAWPSAHRLAAQVGALLEQSESAQERVRQIAAGEAAALVQIARSLRRG
jgi:colanic acid/amylovoran biosynthesis protein